MLYIFMLYIFMLYIFMIYIFIKGQHFIMKAVIGARNVTSIISNYTPGSDKSRENYP